MWKCGNKAFIRANVQVVAAFVVCRHCRCCMLVWLELEPIRVLSFAFSFAQWPCEALQPKITLQSRKDSFSFILVRQFDRFCFVQNRTFCCFYFYFLPSGLKWHFLFEGAGRVLPQRRLEETQQGGLPLTASTDSYVTVIIQPNLDLPRSTTNYCF